MRIAVTGASGFIGRHVVAYLKARGDHVVAAGRPLERGVLAQTFKGADAVVHLAGVVSSTRNAEYYEVNVDRTRSVAQAALDAGARLVHISSLAAAGPASQDAPRGEDDAPAPITVYGRSKLEGERAIVDTRGLAWTILRPGVVYGSGDRALLPLFVLAASGILPLIGRPDAAYTFVHVSDLLRVIATAVDRGLADEVMFVGHPRPVTTRALLDGVRAVVGGSPTVVRVPRPVLKAAALVGDLGGKLRGKPWPMNSRRYAELATDGFVCRVDRLKETLGIVAKTNLDEGLAEAAAWYRSKGWL